MLTLKLGETGNKSTTSRDDESVVDCVHCTVHKSLNDGERFQLNWAVDLRELSHAQIFEAAAEHFIIKIRRTLAKVDKPKNDDWNNVTFNAKDFISTRTSKVDKMAKTLADFSDEQLAELGLIRS